jgi:hypothetical protein
LSINNLYIYDEETNTATRVASGYSAGWRSGNDRQDRFFDEVEEFTGDIEKTKLQVKTDDDLPEGCSVIE